jgi:hypothetical protein
MVLNRNFICTFMGEKSNTRRKVGKMTNVIHRKRKEEAKL